jgi:serine/threonine protein kinase
MTISSEHPVTKPGESTEPVPAGMRAKREPDVGTILKGKYRLESKIGEGGMGVVFRAVDLEALEAASYFAVKLLKPALRTEASKAALFKEVDQTRRFHSDNIVAVYAFEQDVDAAFMVMEFLNGRPLDKLIADDYALGMPFKLAWPIIAGMGHGLKYAHERGIIHSDFKPSNAFVTAVGTKVLDFGIARAAGGPIIGLTAGYASCEMLEGMPPDCRDDVYAFGLVVYKLLSGKHPFCDENGVEVPAVVARADKMTIAPIQGLTRRQQDTLEKALRFDRHKRTKGIQDVLDGLEREGPPVMLWAAVCALLLVILGIAGFIAYGRLATQDSDSLFVASLLKPGAPPAAGEDTETVKDLLNLGKLYLHDGLKPFNPGLLSENARQSDSALADFREVLMLDPSNKSAAEGILAIANAYKIEAKRLFKGGYFKQAADMTKIALSIWPDSHDLKELDSKIRAKMAPPSPQSQ